MGNETAHLDPDRLRAWCASLARYIAQKAPGQSDLADHVNDTLLKLDNSAGDVRALRSLAQTLREWMSVAPIDLQIEVDSLLAAEVGYGLFDDKRRAAKTAATILRRGRIANDDEFRFLSGMLDYLDERTMDKKKIEQMVVLMDRYEQSKERTGDGGDS